MKAGVRLNRNGDVHEVIRGGLTALVVKGVGAGLTFGMNVYIARLFGAEGAGIYFLALSLVTIATVCGRLGLDNALLRFVAAGAATKALSEISGVYRLGITIGVIAAGVAAATLFALAPVLANHAFSKPGLAMPLRVMSIATIPMVFLILHSEMLKGLKRILESQLVYGVGVPGVAIIVLTFFGKSFGLLGAVWAYIVGGLGTAGLSLYLWRRATPWLSGVIGHFPARRLLRSSLPLFWESSMTLVMAWTATLCLGIWGTSADVGIFGAAARTALLISFVLISLNSIAAPKFAALYRQGRTAALANLARESTKFATIVAIPVLIVFLAAPQLLMGVFGPRFAGGADVLRILALGQTVNAATGSVGYLLMMTGNERLVRNNKIGAGLINIILCLVLIPSGGLIGAALATAVSTASLNVGAAYLVWSRLGPDYLPGWISARRRGGRSVGANIDHEIRRP